ncbi:4-hydroxy-tetrahydrodipicolinate synthase [Synechococcus sp. Cruz-9H2]|uniref:4-hydroxy-tetrahydrodipicolinate synthase n=1 Tax=unclassified Synechococcus TaxID=2626047 RepID=UPI0020CEF556|nr:MULTISPECIES: 4-hydroxy-tetrahydrodipicolinate synthase [unclassified Synechococcus]MCP9819483.1 4-hydroxy-tetrahydrodipicolinate synthase [Synechococcus sp. Cruz-9H2]MCP9843787.1 4-hydroxy-tetrahydrodipicolinate synthase [Synechococcus sp. Edmonson 11F2]MCP9855855.1 4-hydroxy-tetrahydrodipicolinate synthase [Synechococcus sp. Cruz-9C9]MCP9863197.1 4-hydroxy-tetrahydrodipicolinate synthase [Synechococcus sp. Cruz-7E5]MCP9870490.1 4-hydroxy-tetrahydrodipicolinate synthase [Synechococcus sp. 
MSTTAQQSVASQPQPPFGRLLTAMVTPFSPDGSVDLDLAARLAAHLVDNGSDGLVLCGTTGESPTLSWQEQHELFEAVKRAVEGRALVLAGTGSNCTTEAIEAIERAAEEGADGALVVVPYYNKPPQDGLEAHFRAIAQAAPGLPVMLYNIPGRTGCSLEPRTTARLLDLPNVVSYKAASGSTDEVSQLRLLCGDRLAIYSGDDALTLPMLAVGAVGVVSVASHLVGREIQRMISSFLAGELAAALALHERLLPLCRALFATTNPIPVKAALELEGWPVGSPRLPLVSADSDVRARLTSALAALRPT